VPKEESLNHHHHYYYNQNENQFAGGHHQSSENIPESGEKEHKMRNIGGMSMKYAAGIDY